jgi:hypothetical protein
MVQNGKLAACALALLKQLKSVDFPTFGKPTIPHFRAIGRTLFSGANLTKIHSLHDKKQWMSLYICFIVNLTMKTNKLALIVLLAICTFDAFGQIEQTIQDYHRFGKQYFRGFGSNNLQQIPLPSAGADQEWDYFLQAEFCAGDLPSGLYVLHLQSNSGKVCPSQKILI